MELEKQAQLLAEAAIESDDLRRLLDELRMQHERQTQEMTVLRSSIEEQTGTDAAAGHARKARQTFSIAVQTDAMAGSSSNTKSAKRKSKAKLKGSVLAGIWDVGTGNVMFSNVSATAAHRHVIRM
jgi:hypothetical protein